MQKHVDKFMSGVSCRGRIETFLHVLARAGSSGGEKRSGGGWYGPIVFLCDLYMAGASHGEAGATPRCCKPLPWKQRAAQKSLAPQAAGSAGDGRLTSDLHK